MIRRDFLFAFGAVAVGWRSGCLFQDDRLERIGVQLYTVRSKLAEDFEGTIRRVAEIGYHEVEFAGYYERTPSQIKNLLDDVGLRAPSAHIPVSSLTTDWERTLDAASTIGHEYLIVAWLAPEQRRTLDDYKRFAALFNRAGEQAQQRGIRFGYHNHDFEFERIGGALPYDVLLTETDPRYVVHELDLFWITKGNADPFAYFERFPGRFHLVHVKDMAPDGSMVDVGAGTIDFARIFQQAVKAGIKHYFVEHDQPVDPFATLRNSLAHLKNI